MELPHIRHGFHLYMDKMLRLQLVRRGIKHSQGDQIKTRMPITIHHLKLFKLLLAIPTMNNFGAAMTFAFFGFFCLGKLTCNSKFNKNIHLTNDTITFSPKVGTKSPQFMTVYIKESKTDPFCLGHTITIRATNCEICLYRPWKSIFHYVPL